MITKSKKYLDVTYKELATLCGGKLSSAKGRNGLEALRLLGVVKKVALKPSGKGRPQIVWRVPLWVKLDVSSLLSPKAK